MHTILEPESENAEDTNVDNEDIKDSKLQSNTLDTSLPISTLQLIAARNQTLQQRKIHIGTLSSGFLENPEEKVTNLWTLLNILDEDIPEIHYTVKKLVLVSLFEIFKDILPSYEIKHISQEGVKCK